MVVLVAALVFDDDPVFRVVYVVGIVLLGWLLAIMAIAQRAGADGPPRIVFTSEGIVATLWTLRWEDVSAVSIGERGKQRWLAVMPNRVSAIATTSRFIALNLRLSGRRGRAPIRIPESIADRPLEELIAEMESAAGRSLHA